MRKIFIYILIVIFQINVSAEEKLFESPVEMPYHTQMTLSEFFEKYVKDVNIEKFIKNEIKNDYIEISLDKCLDITLANNFDVKIDYHNYKVSKYQYKNAVSKFLPLLYTDSYISDFRGQFLVGGVLRDRFHETAISVNITAEHRLTEGGRQICEARAAKYFEKSKNHEYKYSKSEAIYYATRYYYELLLAKLNIEIFLRNLVERNAQLAQANNMYYVGYGTKFDVIRSKSEAAQAKVKLLTALNQFRKAQANLSNIMGINVETALMPFEDDIKPIELTDEKTELEEYFKLAIANREDLKSYKDLISYEKQQKNIILTDFIPKPYIDYQQQFQGTINHSVKPNYTTALYISWMPGENLGVGTYTKIKAQNERIKVKKLEMENTLRRIKDNLISEYSSAYFCKKKISESKNRMNYTTESINLAMGRFNQGQGTLLDVIQAQTEATEARIGYVESVKEYNIAQAGLLFNTGTLNESIIKKNYNP